MKQTLQETSEKAEIDIKAALKLVNHLSVQKLT